VDTDDRGPRYHDGSCGDASWVREERGRLNGRSGLHTSVASNARLSAESVFAPVAGVLRSTDTGHEP
jgi:hypothetical protein